MKLILIDGGPASGKNTLGKLLVNNFGSEGGKSILLDLDSYVEEFCPTWIWQDEKQRSKDLSNARTNFIKDINKYFHNNFNVVAIGQRFLTKEDIIQYTNKLTTKPTTYLYHLSMPIDLRRERLKQRGPHSLIDLDKDQRERSEVKNWPGYVYENVNSPKEDVSNLIQLIKDGVGLLG